MIARIVGLLYGDEDNCQNDQRNEDKCTNNDETNKHA